MNLTELFRFAEGTTIFTQTSAAYAITYNSETYAPYALSRSQAEAKSDMTRASVDIRMDLKNPVAQRYLLNPVESVVTLSIFQQDDNGTNVFWKGRLTQVRATKAEVTLTFESFFTSMRRPGLRARYQKLCRHVLYGKGCGVIADNFKLDTTVLSTDGTAVVVASIAGAPDNRYRGGMLRGPSNVVRFIVGQVGTTITLSRPFPALVDAFAATGTSTPVSIFPGCMHDMDDCDKVFNNLDNMGGFPWIPNKNPMGGSAIT